MNRVEYKLAGRVQADAENATRWDATTVNALFALVFDRGWSRVLDADACYRYTKLTVMPDTDGFVTLASINAQITPERLYRCIDQRTVRDRGLATVGDAVLDPIVLGTNVRFVNPTIRGSVSLWVNHMPQNPESFTGSTADTDSVTWIDGNELCLVYHLAAMLLTKGAVETGASAALFAVVDDLFSDMLQNLMRRTTKLAQFAATDNANDWGGVSW